MKRVQVFSLLLIAAAVACNLPGGLTRLETPTPAPAAAATPTIIPTEPQPAPAPTQTAAPENSPADLSGPAVLAGAPGAWPQYTSGNTIHALVAQGSTLWAGSSSGIVRWETATGQFERFTPAGGLPLTYVFDLALDASGQLWAAGQEGLAVYDGAAWRHISQAEIGLPTTPLRAVAVDLAGSVWTGGDEYFDYSGDPFYIPSADETQGGLARLQNGAWEVFDVVGDGLLSNQINDIAIGPDGSVWVACGQAGSEPTAGGVLRRLPGEDNWRTYTMEGGLDGFAFSSLAFAPDGALWIAGRRGITRLTADSLQAYDLMNTRALAAGPDGTIWVSTFDRLYQYSQGALTPVNIEPAAIPALAVTPGGEVWLGTEQWLGRLAGETLERHYTTDGPLNNYVIQLAFAADNSLWVKSSGGISRLVGERWEHFLDESAAVEAAYPWPLNRRGIWPVDSQGGIWLAEEERLARYDGAAWEDLTPPQGASVRLAPDPNGGVWAMDDRTLLRYLDGAWQTVATLEGEAPFFSANDMLVDTQGRVWAASAIPYIDGGSVIRWDGAWTIYTEADGMAGNATSNLRLAPDGQLWAAHPVRGLSRFDGQRWHVEAGDPRALGLDVDGFISVAFAPDGSMWSRLMSHCGFEGTCFTGIAQRVDGQWTGYRARPDGLPNEAVFDLALNDLGQVWLGTWEGVVAVPDDR